MKTSAAFPVVLVLAALISAQTVIGATQKTPTVHVSKKRMVVAALTANGDVVGLLEQAYALLSNADHDYKGHRTRHACHQSGGAGVGRAFEGRGKRPRATGNVGLAIRAAQSLLQQAS